MTITTCGSSFDTVLGLFDESENLIEENDDAGFGGICSFSSRSALEDISLEGDGTISYFIVVVRRLRRNGAVAELMGMLGLSWRGCASTDRAGGLCVQDGFSSFSDGEFTLTITVAPGPPPPPTSDSPSPPPVPSPSPPQSALLPGDVNGDNVLNVS